MNVIDMPLQIAIVLKAFWAQVAHERPDILMNTSHMIINMPDLFVEICTVGARKSIILVVYIFHMGTKLDSF